METLDWYDYFIVFEEKQEGGGRIAIEGRGVLRKVLQMLFT